MATTQSRSLKMLFTGVLLAVMATVAMTSWAHTTHGGHHGPMGGPGMFLSGSPEHIDRAVDHMFEGIDISDVQRRQLKDIAKAAAKDVRAQMESGRELRARMRSLFTAPTIDEPAVEGLRQQIARQHEAVSRRMTQAAVDAAKVLTPPQREQLAKRFESRRRHMMRHEQGALPSNVPMA